MPRLSSLVISNEREIQATKPNGRRAEYRIKGTRNLVLRVSPTGTRAWSYIYLSPLTCRWRRISLGLHPTISLNDAKTQAASHMVAVRGGVDPLALPPTTDMTFGELAECYIGEHKHRAKSSWTHEIERKLKADIIPHLGTLQAESVTRIDVARAVERVAGRGAFESADHVLGLIRAIFNWGAATGRTEHDPTKGLKKRNLGRPRERVLTDDEIRVLWRALDQMPITDRTISPGIRDAFRLQLLLGVRIGEAVGARKAEIDLAAGIWTIPAARTKSKREHKLPLSSLAVDILRDAMVRAGSSAWLFPGEVDGQPIRPKSASRALLRLRGRLGIENVGTHDLRRTMATRLGDMGVSDELIGRVLNHAPGTVTRRHYNHAARLAELQRALEAWALALREIVR